MEEDQKPKIFRKIEELVPNTRYLQLQCLIGFLSLIVVRYISTDGEMSLRRLASGNVQFQFAPGITLGKDNEFLSPPSGMVYSTLFDYVSCNLILVIENNAQKLRVQLQNETNLMQDNIAAVRIPQQRRPSHKTYSRVAINADDEDDDDEDKENNVNVVNTSYSINSMQQNKPGSIANKPSSKPKPNFSNTKNKVNRTNPTARSPRRNAAVSPRRNTMRNASHAGVSPRRQAQNALRTANNAQQRTTRNAAYAETIPQSGLVARLASKIIQKLFNKKEYDPVELHNMVYLFASLIVVKYSIFDCG